VYNDSLCCLSISNFSDVYTKYPFWKNGIPKIHMALWAWIKQKKGLTDSKPLRKMLRETYTEKMHKDIIQSGKEYYVTVCVLNSLRTASQYVCSSDFENNYEDFCDLIWASTLIPGLFEPLMKEVSIVKNISPGKTEKTKAFVELVDGGTVENLGLKKALELQCKEIDVYMHTVNATGFKEPGKNYIHNLLRSIAIQRQEVNENDIFSTKIPDDTKVYMHYLTFKPKGASVYDFDKKIMTDWFNQGYNM
jgi:predicted acylesterase/phospholipase RssA